MVKKTTLKPTNETAKQKRERAERERILLKEMWNDPRRNSDSYVYQGRLKPLIKDDEE